MIRDTNPQHLRRDRSSSDPNPKSRRPLFSGRLSIEEQLSALLEPIIPPFMLASARAWERQRALEDRLELRADYDVRLSQALRLIERIDGYAVDDQMLERCMLEGDPSPDVPMEELFLPLEFRIGDFDYAMIPVNAAA